VITRIDPKGACQGRAEVSDVILTIRDQPIDGVSTFAQLVNDLPGGRKVTLTVLDHRTGEIGALQVAVR